MKLEGKHGRTPRPRAAEVLTQESEPLDMLFDPRTDFDPEVKRSMLEDLADPVKSWGPWMRKIEYFYALFPDEFAGLQQSKWAEQVKSSIRHSEKIGSFPRLILAEKYAMLFPGSAHELSPYLDKGYIKAQLDSGPEASPIYLHCLFLRAFLFGEPPEEGDTHQQALSKAQLALSILKKDLPTAPYMMALAYFRLIFPEQDVRPLIAPDLQRSFKRVLESLPQQKMKANTIFKADKRRQYAEAAWAATILSAETVGITSDGRIQFELPIKSIRSGPQLPERSAV